MNTQKEDGLRQQNHPQIKESEISIPALSGKVKEQNSLKALRLSAGISAREMVELVQTIYPKYDKTLQSKCENGEEYGVELKADAMTALQARFAPDQPIAPTTKQKENRKYTCRVYCRLPDVTYFLLQQQIRADGFATMQDWLLDMITRCLEEKQNKEEQAHESRTNA